MAKDFVPDSEFPSLEFADPYHTHLAQWLYCLTHLAGTLPHDRSTILDLIADALTNVSKLEFPHSPIYQNTIGGIRK